MTSQPSQFEGFEAVWEVLGEMFDGPLPLVLLLLAIWCVCMLARRRWRTEVAR